MPVLLQNHLPYLLNLNPIQIHSDRLALNAQVRQEIFAHVVEQLVVYRFSDGHAFIGIELKGTL